MLSLGIRVWTFRLNLLLWKHLANWNQTWHDINVHWMVFQKKPVLLFQKRAFPYYIWILIMSPKVDILFYSDFFSRFCFFSAKLVRTITCFSFQIGQLYLVCGCMTMSHTVITFVGPNTSDDRYNLHQSCVPDLYHTTEWLFFRLWGNPPPPKKKRDI